MAVPGWRNFDQKPCKLVLPIWHMMEAKDVLVNSWCLCGAEELSLANSHSLPPSLAHGLHHARHAISVTHTHTCSLNSHRIHTHSCTHTLTLWEHPNRESDVIEKVRYAISFPGSETRSFCHREVIITWVVYHVAVHLSNISFERQKVGCKAMVNERRTKIRTGLEFPSSDLSYFAKRRWKTVMRNAELKKLVQQFKPRSRMQVHRADQALLPVPDWLTACEEMTASDLCTLVDSVWCEMRSTSCMCDEILRLVWYRVRSLWCRVAHPHARTPARTPARPARPRARRPDQTVWLPLFLDILQSEARYVGLSSPLIWTSPRVPSCLGGCWGYNSRNLPWCRFVLFRFGPRQMWLQRWAPRMRSARLRTWTSGCRTPSRTSGRRKTPAGVDEGRPWKERVFWKDRLTNVKDNSFNRSRVSSLSGGFTKKSRVKQPLKDVLFW